jgi:5-methylcytosine-specific restriction protein A
MADADWTDEELRAAVVAYRQILDADLSRKPVSPTAVFRELIAGPLEGRSEGAIGRRMSNLSSVFLAEGLPVATRFRGTLGHVGTNVTRRILAIYADLYGDDPSPTADDAILKARVRKRRGKVGAPPVGATKPKQQETLTYSFVRDPAVCAYVLDRAKGVCEACGSPAPFVKADGDPFLEVHHVVHLAEGGADTIDNAIAACPNCHRRLHHSDDRQSYREAVWERCTFLRRPLKKTSDTEEQN